MHGPFSALYSRKNQGSSLPSENEVGFVTCWRNVGGGENGQDKDIFQIHLGVNRVTTAKPLHQDYVVQSVQDVSE